MRLCDEMERTKKRYLFVFNDAVIDGGVVIILNESKFIIRFYVHMILVLINSSRLEKKNDTDLPLDSVSCCVDLNWIWRTPYKTKPFVAKYLQIYAYQHRYVSNALRAFGSCFFMKCWHIFKISSKLSKLFVVVENHMSSIKLKVFLCKAAISSISVFEFWFSFWRCVDLWHFMIFGVGWKMEWIKSSYMCCCYLPTAISINVHFVYLTAAR